MLFRSVLFSALATTASVFAADETSILFTGQSSETADLTSVLYRNEVREREVTRTCYRTEVRYRTDCGGGFPYPGPYPRPYPGPYPGPFPGGCRTVPVYVDIPYTCTVVEREVVRVFDANVNARVQLNFGDIPAGLSAREQFTVKLDGDRVQIGVDGSGKLLVTNRESVNASRSGNQLTVTSENTVRFYDAEALKTAFGSGAANLSLKNKKLTFKMNALSTELPLRFHLKIVKKRALASDTVVFNEDIAKDRLTLSAPTDGKVTFSNTFDSLGIPSLRDGRYAITLTAEVGFAGETVLNRRDIEGGLNNTRSLELKID